MPSVIELNGLSVRFGTREILKDLRTSLSAHSVGLLGPNGAGKSTLIQTLLGFCPTSGGEASIFGRDIRRERRRIRSLVGYMPENDASIANMTAVSFVSMMGELSGLPPKAALERAHEVLFYVGLGEARYRLLGTYSLGMKQLAKLAQAIVHGPQLLILDEPTNGLDPPARLRMIRLIREMTRSEKMHLVLCSHLLRDVEETCEEVLILKQGRIVHHSNLEEERRANKRFVEIETFGARRAGRRLHARREGPLQNGSPGGLQSARDLPPRRRARPAVASRQLPAGYAGGDLSEGNGNLAWLFTNAPTKAMKGRLPRRGPAS